MNCKIRAWDKINKVYLYNIKFGDRRIRENADHEYDFELCMGKKDSTGKEIYEGDILGTRPFEKIKDGYGGVIKFGEHVRTFATEFDESYEEYDVEGNSIGFYCANRCFMNTFFGEIEDQYIVGNIHTHPELKEF